MKRNIITINDGGVVTIPNGVIRMTDNEIALLLEVMLPTVRGKIKTLLKTRAILDCDMSGGIVSGNRIIPEYFGLEVVVAIAMQVDSYKADIFRKHILSQLTRPSSPHMYIQLYNEHSDTVYS